MMHEMQLWLILLVEPHMPETFIIIITRVYYDVCIYNITYIT